MDQADYFYVGGSAVGGEDPPVLLLLNGVAQGVDITGRIGRRALFTSIQFREHTFLTLGSDDILIQNVLVRYIVFCDKQPNAATPTAIQMMGLLLQDSSLPIVSPLNLNYRARFEVIWDWVHNLGGSVEEGLAVGLSPDQPIFWNNQAFQMKKGYRKIRCMTTYGGTDATAGSIDTNSIYALVLANTNGNTGSESPFAQTYFRLRFRDA